MRTLALLAIALVLMLLQSVLLELLPVYLPAPAFGVLVALHVGLSSSWGMGSAVATGFATGYLFDLVSGAPRGTHALVFTVVTLVAHLLSARLSVRSPSLRAIAGFLGGAAGGILVLLVRAMVDPQGGLAGLGMVPLEALFTGGLGPLVLWLLDRVEGPVDADRVRLAASAGRRIRPAGGGGFELH